MCGAPAARRRYRACITLATALCLAVILGLQPNVTGAQANEGGAALEPPPGDAPDTGLALVVVDFDGVVQRSQAMQSINQSVGGLQRLLGARFREEENRLRQREAELTELRGVLDPEEFARQRRAFEEEIVEIQREAQLQRARLDAAEEAATGRVREALIGILVELADQRSVQAVLDSSTVVLFSPRLDVSDAASARLDEVLPRVNLALPTELIDLLGLGRAAPAPPPDPDANAGDSAPQPGQRPVED